MISQVDLMECVLVVSIWHLHLAVTAIFYLVGEEQAFCGIGKVIRRLESVELCTVYYPFGSWW